MSKIRILTPAAAFALVVCAGIATSSLAARFDFETTPGRLPKDIVPVHYTLSFDVDPARDTFSGRAVIDMAVRAPAASLMLHAVEIEPGAATLTREGGAPRDVVIAPDRKTTSWRIRLASGESLEAGRWRLQVDYQGKVETRGQGLFRVEYRTPDRPAPRRMLASQLEPIHARTVFPSFDEPAFRATFDVIIVAPAGFEPVSNMPVAAQSVLGDGRRRTAFARTPPMPTYLLALAVGEFDAVNDRFEGIPLRILTAPGRAHEGRYAMAVTKQLLGYYRDYFGIDYMLPKLDQLAIPGVRGGAMEDWGAISYNENLLLYDPARSAPRQQHLIFALVAHEVAHQWFGNLVTAAWWDDIWLNEAFATWMQNKTLAHFNPGWKSRVRERLAREDAFATDAGKSTRAVADPPSHESAIADVFDDITYDKGGAVLAMFEAQIGADVFRDGLRRYMAAHRYSNATADDLWYHLSQAAGVDLGATIGGWIRQRGFPLVDVRTLCKDGLTQVTMSQQRFASAGAPLAETLWQIPVVVRAGGSSRPLILGPSPQTLQFPGCVPVVANADDIGYYRVQYDAANMARLRGAYAQLPATERIGLVADSMALARAGRIGFADYFSLLDAARDEREGAVWQQVIASLEFLDDAFDGSAAQPAVRSYARSLLRPVLDRLGWQPQPADDAGTLRIRNALIDALGRFDDAETTARAQQIFVAFTAKPSTPIDPSIRSAVVRTAARKADAGTFEDLRRLLREANNQEDDYLYGGALILVRDPKLVLRILDLGLTDEWTPGAASWYLRNVGRTSGHPALARDFILEHFDAVQAKTSRSGRSRVLPAAYSGFNQSQEADALLAVQRRLLGEAAMAPAEQAADQIREKALVRQREEQRLPALLRTP